MEQSQLKYYCYGCQKSINTSKEIYSCINCDSDAIMFIESKEDEQTLQKFQIFKIQNASVNSIPIGQLQNVVYPRNSSITRTVVSITSTTASLSDFAEGSYLGYLLRQLMADGNSLTAATQQQIQKLQKISTIKECSICQSVDQMEEIQQEIQGFKLSCNHTFHQQCIRPWFQRSNTCPVCRRQIPK